MKAGVFITVEGPDGCGKSTFLRSLSVALGETIEVVITREPGGSPAAEQIRTLLVEGSTDRWDPLTEVLLHSAARNEHVRSLIRPALQSGKWVLSDRFYDSTMAFQGYGMGVDRDVIRMLTHTVLGDLKPDLTFLIDVPSEVGLQRVYDRLGKDEAASRYERMDAAFHCRLRHGYLALAAAEPDRVVVLDGTKSPNEVLLDGLKEILSRYRDVLGKGVEREDSDVGSGLPDERS